MLLTGHPKELGQAQQEMRVANWYKELDKETKSQVEEEVKAIYTPPVKVELTLLNMALIPFRDEFQALAAKTYPYAGSNSKEVNMLKRKFISDKYKTNWDK